MKAKQRTKVKHGILTLIFISVMLLGMCVTVWADESVPYLAWDTDRDRLVEVEGGCTSYTVVTSVTTSWGDGWYVVPEGEVTISERISVNGTAHLILCDGAKLTASKGIAVNKSFEQNNVLNIYGQSKGTGMLVATGYCTDDNIYEYNELSSNYYPGIGSCDYFPEAGDIIIHGGTVTAQGSGYAPGIGGECMKDEEEDISFSGYNGGNVTIYHGTVTAAGGNDSFIGIGRGYSGRSDGVLTLGPGVKLYGSNSDMPEGTGNADLLAIGNGGVYSGDRYKYMKTAVLPPHTHTEGSEEITFQPWTSANSLPDTAGSYYLTGDVTLSGAWNVPSGTTNLCLNGYGITGSGLNGSAINNDGATLNLYDCNSTQQTHYFTVDSSGLAKVDDSAQEGAKTFSGGYITGGDAVYDLDSDNEYGGGVYVFGGGTFSMYGGTIIGNEAEFGGGVYVGNNAEFNLIDGSIAYNTVNGSGGGVDVNSYSKRFNMSNGSITNNTADRDGGGINLRRECTFNMTGGSITDNTANGNWNHDGGGVWVSDQAGCNISGASKITGNKTDGADRNVYLAYGETNHETSKINVDRALSDGAAIGVTLGTTDGKGVFTSGLSGKLPTGKRPADIFFSDSQDLDVSPALTAEGEAEIGKLAATPTFSPAAGEYSKAQNVTINCLTKGATIYYTTDGCDPTKASTKYTGAIKVSSATTIKAIAVKEGMLNSEIASAAYTIKAEPKPTTKPTTKTKPAAKAGGTPLTTMKTEGDHSMTIAWAKVNGAAGYEIYFARCDGKGGKTAKKVRTIKGNKTFTWTVSGLKKAKAYKAYVKAYAKKNGVKKYIGASPLMHVYTSGATKKYTNAKAVRVNKTKVKLKKGKTFQIKAKVKKLKKNKKLMPSKHVKRIRYLSTNKKIATVSKGGKIKAKGKGTCYIYAYAHNGVNKKIKVTVR